MSISHKNLLVWVNINTLTYMIETKRAQDPYELLRTSPEAVLVDPDNGNRMIFLGAINERIHFAEYTINGGKLVQSGDQGAFSPGTQMHHTSVVTGSYRAVMPLERRPNPAR